MSDASQNFSRMLLLLLLSLAVLTPACRQPTNEIETSIDVREPEIYRATIDYSYLPGGNRGVKPNVLFSLDVTRRKGDRGYVFHFGDDEVRYVEGVDRHYLIAPACRQYVEATLEEMNFRIPSSMSPEEIIARLRDTRGWRRAGAEQVGGRAAIKYVGETSARGEIAALIDEATGLPVRAEVVSRVAAPEESSAERGDIYLLVEVRDIATEADDAAFRAPAGYAEVRPPQLCPRVGQLARSATQLLWSISVKKNQ